jgi:DDE superfamily endonuclease
VVRRHAAGRRAAAARHPARQQGAELLLAGGAGAALVPRPDRPRGAGPRSRHLAGHRYRYLEEVTAVLAGQAPGLRQALERASDEGVSHVILDGAVIPADRCRQKTVSVRGEVIDLWYSGKAHTHGANIQAVIAPDGFPLWVSQAEPGSVHDLTATRLHALPALYHAAASGLPALADPGYDGAGIGCIPVKQPAGGRDLDINTRTRNALARLPGPAVLGVPAPGSGTAAHRAGDTRAGAGDGTGRSGLCGAGDYVNVRDGPHCHGVCEWGVSGGQQDRGLRRAQHDFRWFRGLRAIG